MPRDLRNTKLQEEFFQMVGDLSTFTAKLAAALFAKHKKSPPKFYQDDIISIGPAQSKFVKAESVTTIGIYIVNKFVLEGLEVLGYVNLVMTNSVWGDIESQVAAAMREGDIGFNQVSQFINRAQYLFGGPLAHLINPSITPTITTLPPSAAALLKKLLAENADAIAANDPLVSADIEKKVVDEALRVMRESRDPALAFFESGAIDPYNNYKTMFVMKGAVQDNTGESPTGYKIVTSNYNTGIAKSDIPKIADSLVTSAYARGVATQDSGYDANRLNVLFQNVVVQDLGSDCKTTMTMKTTITKRHLYRYITDGGKLVKLTDENISKYIGKKCDLRTPIHCHAPNFCYCSVCIGERPYRIGVHNIGLTFNIISGATLNASMKKFHDSRVKHYTVTDEDLLQYVH